VDGIKRQVIGTNSFFPKGLLKTKAGFRKDKKDLTLNLEKGNME
jgi:hypothetical protein